MTLPKRLAEAEGADEGAVDHVANARFLSSLIGMRGSERLEDIDPQRVENLKIVSNKMGVKPEEVFSYIQKHLGTHLRVVEGSTTWDVD